MAQATFSLESVLKVRSTDRDIERTRLAEAVQAVHQVDEQIAAVEHELIVLRARTCVAVREQTLDVAAIADANRFDSALRRELGRLESRRSQLRAVVDQARASLKQADARVCGLEKLRDRRQEQQRCERQRHASRRNEERLAGSK